MILKKKQDSVEALSCFILAGGVQLLLLIDYAWLTRLQQTSGNWKWAKHFCPPNSVLPVLLYLKVPTMFL